MNMGPNMLPEPPTKKRQHTTNVSKGFKKRFQSIPFHSVELPTLITEVYTVQVDGLKLVAAKPSRCETSR